MTNDDLTAKMMILASSAYKVARTDAERKVVTDVVRHATTQGVDETHLAFFKTVINVWEATN